MKDAISQSRCQPPLVSSMICLPVPPMSGSSDRKSTARLRRLIVATLTLAFLI